MNINILKSYIIIIITLINIICLRKRLLKQHIKWRKLALDLNGFIHTNCSTGLFLETHETSEQ